MTKTAEKPLIHRNKVKSAVQALTELHTKWLEENSQKKPLLEAESDSPLLVQVTLKKIPALKNVQMIKVPLPHSLVSDTTEVCLITGDLDRKDRKAEIEPTILHYKELLAKHGITSISEVISLRQLRTEYKSFESRRQLLAGYDVFLADEKIASCLPRVLGKFFFKKRKFPQQIDLKSLNLKANIEKALSRTIFFLTGHGNSCSTEVARIGFPINHIADNIMAVVKALQTNLPGSWPNVLGLYIKTAKSLAIPVYMSFESGNDVELPSPTISDEVEVDEISTVRKGKIKVFPNGDVEVITDDEYQESESECDLETSLSSLQTNQKKMSGKKKNLKQIKKKKIVQK